MLVGGTFMVTTMAGLQLARERHPANPTPLVAGMTIAFAAGSERLIAGQVQDLENESRQATLAEVKTTHQNKTGALITASIRLGALAGKASPTQLKRLTRYGQDLGLAFQVIDDVLDVTADAATLAASKVTAEVVEHSRGEKIRILRYKNKTGYRRRQGHRQDLTSVKVTGISKGK